MLVHLHVKNLALIDEIEVEFGPGLNILTGETGAGKSILLGSMQLILGGKTSRSMIRENAPYALVELLFQVENTKAKEALAALDIYPEDGQILMSRKIMDGRSINKINGETSTVSLVPSCGCNTAIRTSNSNTVTGSMSTSPFSMRRNSWKSWTLMAVRKSFRKKRR